MKSHYFQAPSNGVRRSPRMTKGIATAATIFTTAVVSPSSVLPSAVVEGFSAASPRQPAKRHHAAAVVTPSTSNKKKKKLKTTTTGPNKKKAAVPLTKSFEPIWSNQFCSNDDDDDDPVPVHTLIVGSHPSIKSLQEQQYYGHPMNAFWWIAGDCLGFRRAKGISESSGQPYQFAKDLRYQSEDHILPYAEQIRKLTMSGFALWDVVASCERPGSLDQDIRKETPNDLRGFCAQHQSSLKRIVIANGGTGCKLFVKHFRTWLQSGQLEAMSNHEASQKAFAHIIQQGEKKRRGKRDGGDRDIQQQQKKDKIILISAIGVSPANARFSYAEKRDSWEELVYQPGLCDYEKYKNRQRL